MTSSMDLPRGFKGAGISAGIKSSGAKDLALIVNEGPQIFGTAVFTIPMILIAFRTSTPIAVALLPYQAWVATAATLSYQYSRLN